MSALPPGVIVVERGWLSSNTVVLVGGSDAAVIDSGYCTHAALTLGLVDRAVGFRTVATLVNTHLHSDHCGGNAALQSRYPALRTLIPPGLAAAVRDWDQEALTYAPTGQECPRFRFDGLLVPGTSVALAQRNWEVHAAPGHDPHSVVLFEPETRTLVSADALWENGFGVVFPELEGESAFDDVAATLDVIEGLRPNVVIPGHGGVFTDVAGSLSRARSRLQSYVQDPRRHAAHAAKVLLKFKLLELQQVSVDAFLHWAETTPYFLLVQQRFHPQAGLRGWIESLLMQLQESRTLRIEDNVVRNA